MADETVTYRELLLVGAASGLLENFVNRVARAQRALANEPDLASPETVRRESVRFRRARHLESGEDLRAWLAGKDLTLRDLELYCRRLVVRTEAARGEPVTPPDPALSARELLAELSFEGAWRKFADEAIRLFAAERIAGALVSDGSSAGRGSAELCRTIELFGPCQPDWCAEHLAAFARRSAALQVVESTVAPPEKVAARLADRSIEWTVFSYDEVNFSSEGAAREALACAREDQLSASEIAARAGREVSSETRRRDTLPKARAAILEGATSGEATGPVPTRSGAAVVWLRARSRPTVEDAQAAAQAAGEILAEALERAVLGIVRELEVL